MAGALATKGYERYDLVSALTVDDLWGRYAELRSAFADLPPDPYGAGLNRYRRYAAAILLPWQLSVHWLPSTYDPALADQVLRYYQGDYNGEHPGAVRNFPALPVEVLRNPLLEAIVLFDFAQTDWPPAYAMSPFYVGVHFIKLRARRAGERGMTSPNCLHQDGEPFHFAHLVERSNAVGGENVIGELGCLGMLPDEAPEKELIDRFTLTEPLEAYGIRDDRVSHHLEPITKGDGSAPGLRTAILVDITPMRKDI